MSTWAILMSLTALSWWLGSAHGLGAALATTAILLIAFAKVFVVGNSFMELRHAAPALRRGFAGWCMLACAALVVVAIVS